MAKDYKILYEDTFEQLRDITREKNLAIEDLEDYRKRTIDRYKDTDKQLASLKGRVTKLENELEHYKNRETPTEEEYYRMEKKYAKMEQQLSDVVYNVSRIKDMAGRTIPKNFKYGKRNGTK